MQGAVRDEWACRLATQFLFVFVEVRSRCTPRSFTLSSAVVVVLPTVRVVLESLDSFRIIARYLPGLSCSMLASNHLTAAKLPLNVEVKILLGCSSSSMLNFKNNKINAGLLKLSMCLLFRTNNRAGKCF